MTIGIDIRILGNSRRSGIVEYAEQLVARMIEEAPEHTFKLFFSSFRQKLPAYDWLSAKNVTVYSYRIPNNTLFLANRFFNWPLIDRMLGGVDVFFSPHFFIASLSNDCRRFTTFHDLSYLRFPEFFTLGKRLWHTIEMNPIRQARLSDRIIAVSESTKSDLVEMYHIDPANISVVHSGVSMKRPAFEHLEHFKRKHDLPKRFVFSLSTLEPRKNTKAIIRAFVRLKEMPGFDDCWLVLGGDRGWLSDDIIKEMESSSALSHIKYVGYISDDDRPYYYAAASVFAYPSFFEGFGLPVLEAMACGTPVVTSHNSSLPEVAGDAALLIDPYNVADITYAFELLLNDQRFRTRCIDKGTTRAKEFSWDRSARETLRVLTGF